MSAIAYLDRVNISIAGKAIARDFHLDDVELGWVFSAFVPETTHSRAIRALADLITHPCRLRCGPAPACPSVRW